MRKLSFVIPCYNSAKTVPSVIDGIVKTVKPGDDYEIICVNDGSSDEVLLVLKELAEKNSKIKIINLAKNFGQHNALMAGYRHVTGDVVVSLDDDGQTPANESYKLIDALGESLDVVYARYEEKKHSLFRRFGSYISTLMGRSMIGMPKDLYGSSFFACKRFVIDEIVRYDAPYTFIAGLIIRSTNKLGNVDIHHQERLEGSSGYSLTKLLSLWLNGFTSFSVKPLRVASILGLIVAILGFLFGLVLIIRKILNPEIAAGYSSLMAVLLLVGGLLMIMLGLVGEYIGRAYISLNKAPQYVIKETVNIEDE